MRVFFLGILRWGFLAIIVGGFALFVFDPMGARHFLLDADYAKTLIPIARFVGVAGGLLLTVPVVLGYRKQKHNIILNNFRAYKIQKVPLKAIFEVVIIFLFSPVFGYVITYESMKNLLPVVHHYFSDYRDFSAAFTIEGVVSYKGCQGVVASNAEFFDDEICGVSLVGAWSPYYNMKMNLSGKRSAYGLMVEHYRLPDAGDDLANPATSPAMQPCGFDLGEYPKSDFSNSRCNGEKVIENLNK